jgi:tRNA U55 pseudouridine synthase TruB
MSALRRTSSNGFDLKDARSLEEIQSYAEQDRLSEISIDPQSAFSHLSEITVPSNGETYYLNGGTLTIDRLTPVPKMDGLYRAYSQSERFLGLALVESKTVKCVFSAEV